MISLFKKIIINKKKSSKKILNRMRAISKLSEEINVREQEMKNIEHTNLIENKEEMYIPLSHFIEVLDVKNFNLDIILSKCKHVSEINKMKSSTVDVFSIVEDDHIVLCPDVNTCEKHKHYKGDKIRITTVRR